MQKLNMGIHHYNMLHGLIRNSKIITTLIKAGVNVNALNKYGQNSFKVFAAQSSNNPKIVTILIKAGSDVNGRSNKSDFLRNGEVLFLLFRERECKFILDKSNSADILSFTTRNQNQNCKIK